MQLFSWCFKSNYSLNGIIFFFYFVLNIKLELEEFFLILCVHIMNKKVVYL